MAETTIRLKVDGSQPIKALKQVTKESKKLEGAVTGVNAGLNKQGRAAKDAANGLAGLKSAIASVGITLLIRRVATAAATFNSLQLRLKLLTREYGEFEKAQDLVARSAKKFGLSNREAAQGIADIFARLRPLGVSLKDIESTFVGFNTVAKLSGVQAQQASAAFTQLAQALGSGRLQGDEFRSISEQIPGLLTAVSDVTGVAQGKLKDYASQGVITSDVVIAALKKVEREGGAAIKEIVEESDVQKFKDFQNAVDDLSIAVGNQLLPTLIPLIKAATDLITAITNLPKPIKDTVTNVVLFAAKALLLTKAIKTIIALKAGVVGMLSATAGGMATTGSASVVAAGKVNILATAFKRILPLMAAFAAFDFLTAASTAGASLEEVQARLDAGGSGARFEGADREVVEVARKNAKATVDAIDKELENIAPPAALLGVPGIGPAIAATKGSRAQLLNLRKLDAETVLGLDPKDFKSVADKAEAEIEEIRKRFANFELEGDSKSGKGTKKEPSVMAGEKARAELQAIRDKVALAQTRTNQETRMVELQQKIRDIDASRSLIGDDLADKQIQEERGLFTILEIKEAITNKTKENAKAEADATARFLSDFDAAFAQRDAQLEAQAQKMDQLYSSIGNTITTGIVDSLTAAVDGTKSLAEVASDTLRSLVNIMLKFGIQTFLGGLGGGDPSNIFTKLFGGGRASGGTVKSGMSYMVGERGPELFSPGRSGSIAPNGSLGGGANVTVNVDASGSSVEGDNDQAGQLGKAIGIAVQQELIKQKRPGGLLTR